MRNYCVLENDIELSAIKQDAEAIGFSNLSLKLVIGPGADLEYSDYVKMISQKILSDKIRDYLFQTNENCSLFFLTKGEYIPDSRTHQGLKHRIDSLHVKEDRLRGKVNEPLTLQATIKNTGEAKWLVDNIRNIGVVFVGMHLYDSSDNLLDLDFYRKKISKELYPGDETSETLSIMFPNPGTYHLIVDLVSESVCWFEQLGSVPQRILVEIV